MEKPMLFKQLERPGAEGERMVPKKGKPGRGVNPRAFTLYDGGPMLRAVNARRWRKGVWGDLGCGAAWRGWRGDCGLRWGTAPRKQLPVVAQEPVAQHEPPPLVAFDIIGPFEEPALSSRA